MRTLRLILVGGALLTSVNARAADVQADRPGQPVGSPVIATDEYAFDSGFGTTNVAGYGAGGSMFWLNQFTVVGGLEAFFVPDQAIG